MPWVRDNDRGDAVLSPGWKPLQILNDIKPLHPLIQKIAQGSFRQKQPPAIHGSGWVVKSLQASLWAFHGADTFEEAVLRAVNLGDDADTTGAICGQLAGAFWGESGIPESLRSGLARMDMIESALACIIGELRRLGDGVQPHAFHFRCAGVATGRQFQDAIELSADQSFTLFGKALRESGESVLILDDLDFTPADSAGTPPTTDDTIEALYDFCPSLSIIRITALACPPELDPIRIGRLDVADTRSYLNKAPKPVHLTSTVDYKRVHRVTGGVPIYLDEFISALDVTDIEGAIAQADAQPIATGDALHESIVREIKELQCCSADEMKRTRALLWTLAILEQGESLGAIKRLDGRAPIWPKNASYLQSRGCLESLTITAKFTTSGPNPVVREGDKILRISRLVRDYVLSIMTNTEREEIVRNVATLYFSDDWRLGIVRMRRRLAIGTEISTHQSGNELAILKSLLQSREVYFGPTASVAFQLALSYVGQLKSKGFYGEAYEAAKDTLAIVESMHSAYGNEEVYHIHLLAASCARMVGEREACVMYLQTALPSVRASGVKARLAGALVNLSMALHSLKRNSEAKAAAEEILQVAPKNSSDYLQAKATLAEINMSRADAVRYLRSLATKAKNLGHFTVADNATLEVVSDSDNTEEKLRLLKDITSRRDLDYNFVRATIRRIETLIDAGRESELTATDREDLWFSYRLTYSQRMASIFDWCHRVCWKYLIATNGKQQLGELYMHSSFVLTPSKKREPVASVWRGPSVLLFPSMVSLAKPFSSCLLRCLVHVSLAPLFSSCFLACLIHARKYRLASRFR